MYFTMARLLPEFDLATKDGNNLDMSEEIGVLIRKATTLKVILTLNYHPIYIPQGLIVALRKNKERHWCFSQMDLSSTAIVLKVLNGRFLIMDI